MSRVLLMVLMLVFSGGCTRSNPGFTRSDARPDGPVQDLPRWELGLSPDLHGGDLPPAGTPRGVDVLIVVDNSSNMGYPQQWLARDIDTLIAGLDAMPGGANYRIGVTTTDMGVGAYGGSGCTGAGDRGELVVPPSCPKPQGQARYVERIGAKTNVTTSVQAAVACLIKDQGTSGCGFEQPLKAMKAALTTTNKGFLRPDAALAVVVLTNEDDCSAVSNTLYNPADLALGPYSSYRCFQHGVLCNGQKPPLKATLLGNCVPGQSWLYDVKTEYADLLRALRPAGWTSVLVIAGPPTKTITVEQTNIAPPRFAVKESCSSGELDGVPALRLEELVTYMGAYGGFASVCDGDYRLALKSLLLRIQVAF